MAPATDEIPQWQEVESEVYQPGLWIGGAVGFAFLSVGIVGMVSRLFPAGPQLVLTRASAALFALLGGVVAVHALRRIIWRTRVRHASPDVLPDVPPEPVIREGSVVHGRLAQELVDETDRYEMRPARRGRRNDQIFLCGLGVPFLIVFAGILSWFLHKEVLSGNWLLSIVSGVFVTLICGGSVLLFFEVMLRLEYRRLCRLTIPRDGDDLQLDSPHPRDLKKLNLGADLDWLFRAEGQKQRVTISRSALRAVQLCPWKFAMGPPNRDESMRAVQGLLVFATSTAGTYERLPIVLTSDSVRAARLMQQLAATLRVPYLFGADAAGWQAEERRAKTRQPFRVGGKTI